MQEALIDTPFGPLEIRVTQVDGEPVIEVEYVTPRPSRTFAFTATMRMDGRVRPLPLSGGWPESRQEAVPPRDPARCGWCNREPWVRLGLCATCIQAGKTGSGG